jgi:hypothetical protein
MIDLSHNDEDEQPPDPTGIATLVGKLGKTLLESLTEKFRIKKFKFKVSKKEHEDYNLNEKYKEIEKTDEYIKIGSYAGFQLINQKSTH